LYSFRHVGLDLSEPGSTSTRLLDDITLDLPAGRLIAIVGPSGAGKSTLLRMCNGLERATSGTIRWLGRDLATVDVLELRRSVGMVFQRPTPFAGTVADNLRVADPHLSDGGCGELLRLVELDPSLLDRDASTLSGGEAQRMCIARTLAVTPAALLMDEPTAALDLEHRRSIEGLARRFVDERSLSVLWVSHDEDQVERVADVVVEMAAGRVVEVRTP